MIELLPEFTYTQWLAIAAAFGLGVFKYGGPVLKTHWVKPFGVDVPTPAEVERVANWLEASSERELAGKLRNLPIRLFSGSQEAADE